MCNLNNYNPCRSFNINGIRRISIIDYGKLEAYRYDTNSNRKFITNYNALSNFVEYSIFDGTLIEEMDSVNRFAYKQSLKVIIPNRTYQFQKELESLNNRKITIIVEDKNGKAWIIGKNAPCYMDNYINSSDNNNYEVTFSSITTNNAEEIKPINKECFSSFVVNQQRISSFEFKNAASIDWSGLIQITADSTNLSINPSIPFDLTNASLYNSNINTLNLLISTYTTNFSVTYNYDVVLDKVILTIQSADTSFDNFTLNDIIFRSNINIQLGINIAVAGNIMAANPIISVKDSLMNTVYSGHLSDDITDVGMSGVASNALLDVSLLYPNGTTLSFELTGVFNCGLISYEYIVEPTSDCSIFKTLSYKRGKQYTLFIPTFTTNTRFRRIEWYVDGHIFIQNPTIGQHHSSFPQFNTDVRNLFGNYAANFRILSINDHSTFVEILIEDRGNNISNELKELSARHFGYISGNNSFVNDSLQSRLLNVETLSTSNITYSDVFNNTLTGNVSSINNNGFDLQKFDSNINTNDNIYNVSFNTNQYNESQYITARYSSAECPTFNSILKPNECVGKGNISEYGRYYLLTMQDYILGNSFTIEFNSQTFNYTLPNAINGDNITSFIEQTIINSNIFIIKSMRYCNFTNLWHIEIVTKDANVEFVELRANTLAQNSTIIDEYIVYKHTLPLINANTSAEFQLTSINPFNPSISNISPIGYTSRYEYNRLGKLLGLTSDGMDITIDVLCLNNNGIEIEFRDNSGAVLVSYNIGLGTYTGTFPLLADITSAGYNINDIGEVLTRELNNNEEWVSLTTIDITNNTLFVFKEYPTMNVWGSVDCLLLLGNEGIMPNIYSEVNSLACDKWRLSQLQQDGTWHRAYNIDSSTLIPVLYNPLEQITNDSITRYNLNCENNFVSLIQSTYNIDTDITTGVISMEVDLLLKGVASASTLIGFGRGGTRSYNVTLTPTQIQIRVGNGYNVSDLYVRFPFNSSTYLNSRVHFVITMNGYNGSNVNCFINGTQLSGRIITTNSLTSISTNSNNLWQVADFTNGYYQGVAALSCHLYKVTVYNKTLTVNEIAALYNGDDCYSLDNNRIFDIPFSQREGISLINTATLLTTPALFHVVGGGAGNTTYGQSPNLWGINNDRFISGYPTNVVQGNRSFDTNYAQFMKVGTFITFYDNDDLSPVYRKKYWYKIIGINGTVVTVNSNIIETVSNKDMYIGTIESINNPYLGLNTNIRSNTHSSLENLTVYEDGNKKVFHKNINRVGGLKYNLTSAYNPAFLNVVLVVENYNSDTVYFAHGESIKVYSNNSDVYIDIYNGGTTTTLSIGSISVGLNIIHLTFEKDANNVTGKGSINGSTITSSTQSNSNNSFFDSINDTIGTTINNISIKKVGSFDLYDVFRGTTQLTTPIIDKLVGYYAHYHDITNKLPLLHPYKTFEPLL